LFERVSFGEGVVKIKSYKLVWVNGVGSILKCWGSMDNIGGT